MMKLVKCTNGRKDFPDQLKVGKEYFIDSSTIFEYHGDKFVQVYDSEDEHHIGCLLTSHFDMSGIS